MSGLPGKPKESACDSCTVLRQQVETLTQELQRTPVNICAACGNAIADDDAETWMERAEQLKAQLAAVTAAKDVSR